MEFHINMDNKKVFIFTGVVFLVGIINGLINVLSCKRIHMGGVIIGFIPISILIIRNTISQRENFKYYRVVTPAVVGVFISIFVLNFYATKIMDIDGVNMNVGDYQKYLRLDNYSQNKYINHFPKEIPSGAKMPYIKEWTGFTYDSIGFYLSYNISDEGIEQIKQKDGTMQFKEVIENVSELKSTKQVSQLPKQVIENLEIDEDSESNFEIYIIDSSDVTTWNHGYSYGIGINYDTNKVLYFAENWWQNNVINKGSYKSSSSR